MARETFVVIGGGPAGMTAASRVKRLKPDARVVVFERSRYVSYAACGIPYYLGGLVDSLDRLVHYPVSVFREKRGIEVYTETEVVSLEPGRAEARGKEGDFTVEWDTLLVATGARPVVPPIPGVDLDGVATLRILEDAERTRKLLEGARRVAVVGGGYIGLEVSENLRERGLEVLLFEMLPHVMPTLDGDMASYIEEELRRHGVELHTGEPVRGIRGSGRAEAVETDKGVYPVDAVILAVGVRPDTRLAEMLGLELGARGAVRVDSKLRTSMEGVYAAGDVAETFNRVTGKPDWIPLAPTANKMGYVAGTNMAGGDIEFPGVVGTAVTKVFGLEIGRTGLTEKQAREAGFETLSVHISAKTRPGYYPGGGVLRLKLVADKASGRLLGLQAVGVEVLPRIDAAAALLYHGATVKDAFFTDMAYAPPFAPAWDPLVIAARVAMRKLK